MREQLHTQLAAFPRFPLTQGESPLEDLPQLSRALRRPVLIKRDDQLGPALGGNKARKLEYLIADAKRKHYRRVATFGGLQSNHARMTAAACRMAGLEPHLFYMQPRPASMTGNLLLAELVDACFHFIPLGGNRSMPLERANRLVHLLAQVLVGRHYFIPVGGHTWLGCLGYVQCALELEQQLARRGLRHAHVLVAAGTGGTLAGLLAGFTLLNSSHQVLGIDIGKLWTNFGDSVAHMATAICARLGRPDQFDPSRIPLIEGRYVGPRYGVPDAATERAIKRLAYLDGLVLDPIYTGKAFTGMLDMVERGELGRNTPLVFVHTGGVPGIFR